MTAQRLLELLPQFGVQIYLRDGEPKVRGPKKIVAALMPQLKHVGRRRIVAELQRQERDSQARLSALLGRKGVA
jgi:hypothetical protein